MKIADVILAAICGLSVAFAANDILGAYATSMGGYSILMWVGLPVISLICLQAAFIIGKKALIMFQAAKHLLVGAFATVIDLKFFEFLVWIFVPTLFIYVLAVKGVSFIFSTAIKYVGNKYWAFQKPENENVGIKTEIFQFFIITLMGLIIDVCAFYYATKVMGPQFQISPLVWTKLSIIFAALAAAVWNFLGYKFLVFKK